jgi:hypothetical protein
MRFKPPNCKRLQGAAGARRWVRGRTFVLQVLDNKADAVPCERLRKIGLKTYESAHGALKMALFAVRFVSEIFFVRSG